MSDTIVKPELTPTGVQRAFVDRPVELRAAPDGSSSPGVLTGYAIVFESLSRDLGGWFEVIDPGALGEAVDGQVDMTVHGRVIARTNHDSNLLLGTSNVGTLRLFLDDEGVRYEVDLPDTSYARDLAVLAARGDIQFSSFAFRTPPEGREWTYDEQDRLISRVRSLILADVAPVADPAYWGSSSQMRSAPGMAPDLDAVRASLKPPPGPPGEWESGWLARVQPFDTNPKENTL